MKERRVLLGVSGGIAAYKAAELARLLVKEGAAVRVVMTRAATRFVAPLTFEALSGNPVSVRMFGRRTAPAAEHIELSRWAEALLIAPATANCLAKLALGLADDLLSTTALAFGGGLLLAPAMNSRMWAHPAVQANVELLRGRGAAFVGPEEGELACGEKGLGRMAEPGAILRAVKELLAGKHS